MLEAIITEAYYFHQLLKLNKQTEERSNFFNKVPKQQYSQIHQLKNDGIDKLSKQKNFQLLDYWIQNNLKLDYTSDTMDIASQNGHIDVLQWWWGKKQNYGIKLKYSNIAIDHAYYNKQVIVLNWWLNKSKNHGIQLKYSQEVMNQAIQNEDEKFIKQIMEKIQYFNIQSEITQQDEIVETKQNQNCLQFFNKIKRQIFGKYKKII